MLGSRGAVPDAKFPANIIIGGFSGRPGFYMYAVSEVFLCWNYINAFLTLWKCLLTKHFKNYLTNQILLWREPWFIPNEDNSKSRFNFWGKSAICSIK